MAKEKSTTKHPRPHLHGGQWVGQAGQAMRSSLRGFLPDPDSGFALADTDEPLTDAHFAADLCRNCGIAQTTRFCAACGQKKVARFRWRDVVQEFWEKWRWFEQDLVRGALRLASKPGTVAREYVLGARKRHVHPLKLLLVAVGVMIVVQAKTGFLTAGQTAITDQMKLVTSFSRWSFSLSLFAIFFTSLLMFRGRLHYNPVEHLVLAVYAQFLVVLTKLLNMLPLLLLPQWTAVWRDASKWYLIPIELLIVAVAYQQFFRLRWRADAGRLIAALLLFLLIKRGLQYGYGRLIHQMLMQTA